LLASHCWGLCSVPGHFKFYGRQRDTFLPSTGTPCRTSPCL